MDPTLITIIVIASFFIFLMAGMPVFGALGMASVIGILLLQGPRGLGAVPGVIYDRLAGFTLVAVPLFILMGEIIFVSGIGADIYVATSRWLNRMPGSLGMSSVAACAIFSALCGVSLAGAATIGSFAIPEMLKRGYDKSLATGCVAASGGLALLIPPSVALILYGVVGDESVGKLFIGGIIPGILLAALMMGYIFVLVNIRPHLAPRSEDHITWGMRFSALANIWPVLALIVLVLGSIYAGIATPTEAAAVGCIGAFVVGFFRKRLNWTSLSKALKETLRTSGMIYIVVIGALIFSVFISLSGLAENVAQLLSITGDSRIISLLIITIVLLLLGSILDGLALMLLTTPIFLPIIQDMGMSPIWFGIFLVRAMEVGFIHPPIGMNLFIINNIAKDVSLSRIFKGVLPFLASDFVHLLLLIFIPATVTWLPAVLGQ